MAEPLNIDAGRASPPPELRRAPAGIYAMGAAICAGLALAALMAGCTAVTSAVKLPGKTVRAVIPGKKKKNAVDPVEVQQTLLRFADEFLSGMTAGIDRLRRGSNAIPQAEVLQWKLAVGTKTTSIASGPNAVANLLDMTVFVTMTRKSLEEYWQPKIFRDSAGPLRETCSNAETEIWQMAGTVLKPAQQEELRSAIESWHRQNPLAENVMSARAVGFATEVMKANKKGTPQADSVFNLLNLDPLSGLDPAVAEIAQTRLFAERALYVARNMPVLLRWQTELLTINAANQPAVQQLVTNTTQVAASAERFAGVAEKLPGQVSAEREEILKGLEAHEKSLVPLVSEVRQTLATGTEMSSSLNTTVTTFDALMKRFGVGETNRVKPPETNSEPFRILDYEKTAAQLEVTARRLTELLVTFDQTLGSTNMTRLSAQVGTAVEKAQSGGKQVVDYAFWKAILLVGIVLAAALVYRLLVPRRAPTTSSSK